eukprot:gene3471-13532_t
MADHMAGMRKHELGMLATAYGGSQDPEDAVPLSEVAAFIGLMPTQAEGRCKGAGCQIVQGLGGSKAVLFPAQGECRPKDYSKMPTPWISEKGGGAENRSRVTSEPPELSSDLLCYISRLSGTGVGTGTGMSSFSSPPRLLANPPVFSMRSPSGLSLSTHMHIPSGSAEGSGTGMSSFSSPPRLLANPPVLSMRSPSGLSLSTHMHIPSGTAVGTVTGMSGFSSPPRLLANPPVFSMRSPSRIYLITRMPIPSGSAVGTGTGMSSFSSPPRLLANPPVLSMRSPSGISLITRMPIPSGSAVGSGTGMSSFSSPPRLLANPPVLSMRSPSRVSPPGAAVASPEKSPRRPSLAAPTSAAPPAPSGGPRSSGMTVLGISPAERPTVGSPHTNRPAGGTWGTGGAAQTFPEEQGAGIIAIQTSILGVQTAQRNGFVAEARAAEQESAMLNERLRQTEAERIMLRQSMQARMQAALKQQQDASAMERAALAHHAAVENESLRHALGQQHMELERLRVFEHQKRLEDEKRWNIKQGALLQEDLDERQGELLQEVLNKRRLFKLVTHWRDKVEEQRNKELRIRTTMAQTRVDLLLRGGGNGQLRMLSSEGSPSAKRRRKTFSDTSPPFSPFATEPAASSPHLQLLNIVLPRLCPPHRASSSAMGASQPGASTVIQLRLYSSNPYAQQIRPARSVPGSGADTASPGYGRMNGKGASKSSSLSSLHLAAAIWLRTKLSAGRLSNYNPPAGDLLTLTSCQNEAQTSAASATWGSLTMSVIDVSASAMTAQKDFRPHPGYSSATMAATSAIMLLVAGPPAPPPGARHHPPRGSDSLPEQTKIELGAAWDRLKTMLEHLHPAAYVPLVVLMALSDQGGYDPRGRVTPNGSPLGWTDDAAAAVSSHAKATARSWPAAVASRVSSIRIIPLLPPPPPSATRDQAPGHSSAQRQQQHHYAAGHSSAHKQQQQHSATGHGSAHKQNRAPVSGLAEAAVVEALRELSTQHPPQPALHRLPIGGLVRGLMDACLEAEGTKSTVETLDSFNQGIDELCDAVQQTSTSSAAAWGLPAPEACPSSCSKLGNLTTCAPACWAPATMESILGRLASAKLPPSTASGLCASFESSGAYHADAGVSPPPSVAPHHPSWPPHQPSPSPSAANGSGKLARELAGRLHQHVAKWQADMQELGGVAHCWILQELMPLMNFLPPLPVMPSSTQRSPGGLTKFTPLRLMSHSTAAHHPEWMASPAAANGFVSFSGAPTRDLSHDLPSTPCTPAHRGGLYKRSSNGAPSGLQSSFDRNGAPTLSNPMFDSSQRLPHLFGQGDPSSLQAPSSTQGPFTMRHGGLGLSSPINGGASAPYASIPYSYADAAAGGVKRQQRSDEADVAWATKARAHSVLDQLKQLVP